MFEKFEAKNLVASAPSNQDSFWQVKKHVRYQEGLEP